MKNITAHPIDWSIQSVSQYDTADPHDRSQYNHHFWAFTPVNPESAYLEKYHVRSGPSDHPSFSVRDGSLFALHWVYLEAEVWLDSPAGWVGSFGVFYPGGLVAHLYDHGGVHVSDVALMNVSPLELITLDKTIKAPPWVAWLSVHLVDQQGRDRGALGQVHVNPQEKIEVK